MEIKKTIIEDTINLSLSGRLDTITSNDMLAELGKVFEADFNNLVFDFSGIDYISSAGLRVLLVAQKKVNSMGADMKIIGASDTVKEVFEITGFTGIMTIEYNQRGDYYEEV